ncbi:hypothetical protein PMZ80_002744 [Knufia obscura]|uniref:RNase H type-1 domain-containing protein n=1 Tax=Knufia obscura TaxID=1635080 RepID=A0ABR0RY81_9EURO|nr:hypothetical protein PMZ80_002744 [Knufia obscura]
MRKKGEATALDRDDAEQAARAEATNLDPGIIVFWSDASKNQAAQVSITPPPHATGVGCGITMQSAVEKRWWKDYYWPLERGTDINDAELLAMVNAIEMSIDHIEEAQLNGGALIREVRIYSDSKFSIEKIRDWEKLSQTKQNHFPQQREIAVIKHRSHFLSTMGVLLKIRCVPAHNKPVIDGNDRADRLAKAAAVDPWAPTLPYELDGILRNPPPRALGVAAATKLTRRGKKKTVQAFVKSTSRKVQHDKVVKKKEKNKAIGLQVTAQAYLNVVDNKRVRQVSNQKDCEDDAGDNIEMEMDEPGSMREGFDERQMSIDDDESEAAEMDRGQGGWVPPCENDAHILSEETSTEHETTEGEEHITTAVLHKSKKIEAPTIKDARFHMLELIGEAKRGRTAFTSIRELRKGLLAQARTEAASYVEHYLDRRPGEIPSHAQGRSSRPLAHGAPSMREQIDPLASGDMKNKTHTQTPSVGRIGRVFRRIRQSYETLSAKITKS